VEVRLAEELLTEVDLRYRLVQRLLGDLAYRSEALEGTLAERGVLSVTAIEAMRREATGRDRAFEP
jgi:hypothetical protein